MRTQNTLIDPYLSPNAQSGVTQSGAGKYPNPFCDIASEYVPEDINSILSWSEYLMMSITPFRAVTQRVMRYFLTEVELEGASDDERDTYEDFLQNKLHLMQQLAEVGDDYATYGNAFVSIYFPFDRYLRCPICKTEYHAETIDYKFKPEDCSLIADCNACESSEVTMVREDRRSTDTSRVRIIRWNPKQMRLRVHPVSGRISYYMVLESDFVDKICRGDPFYLNDTPWPLVRACAANRKDPNAGLFKFNRDAIYHMKSAALSGLKIRGWGIPPLLPMFKLAYYIQLLRRYDEAIALDFIVPFRVLYPENSSPGGDILSTINMNAFASRMRSMVENKRKNITDIQVSPFAVGYQMVGGEARQLAPKDSIELALSELMNAMGYPAEMYNGTLVLEAAPVAIRLFEKQWGPLVDGYNDLVAWILLRVSRHFMWGEITGKLRSVTLADDLDRKMRALQAAAGMDISKQTAYRPLGIDYMEEQRRVVDEQQQIQELQQQAMEDAMAAQMSGDGEAGGDGGAAVGATPGDVYEQAGAMAEQLLLQVPETLRRGELMKIKHSNPTLHALVIQRMSEMRQEMSRQGQAMMMEEAKQGM